MLLKSTNSSKSIEIAKNTVMESSDKHDPNKWCYSVFFCIINENKISIFRLPERKNRCFGHPPVAVSERCGPHCRHEQCKETIPL